MQAGSSEQHFPGSVINMQRAFVIRPFNKQKDKAGREIDFEKVHNELIAPALKAAGLEGDTTGEIVEPGNIREDMFSLILEADLVVCDVTIHNANVFYELGIRHALRKKRSVLIKGKPVEDSTPFDILTDRYQAYSVDDPASAKDDLLKVIRAALVSERETDSPIFKMLPALPEVDPTTVQVIPKDLAEEIGRASAAKSLGWLRLLSSEVQGRRFQWPAMRLIGQAQWAAGDNDGAIETWDTIRDNDANDIPANLALANLYERRYRRDKKPEWLEMSNQAIARVLVNVRTSAQQRAEAQALNGRNAKTLWRLDFENLPDMTQRRSQATNAGLLKSYEYYRAAYLYDLNHFWSGLAALQMAAIAKALSGDSDWENLFDDADRAQTYANELGRQIEILRSSTWLAIQAAIDRSPAGEERMWAGISRADLRFLSDDPPQRVEKTYLDAIPGNNYFAWMAAKGQLELFASLGIKQDLVARVIAALDAKVRPAPPEPDFKIVIFAGHRIDETGRAEPRFPAAREARARQLIRGRLEGLKAGGARVRVIASAAPGADILCHEVCKELDIDSTICLPMPAKDFSREVFGDLDDWRGRFLAIVDSRLVLQLSDKEGLPRWLEGSGLNPWERGNQWVLEMAQTSGAKKVSLIALWDGKLIGDDNGGTAHMVQIARDAGTIGMDCITFRELFAD
jgi:hypothetical protein